MSYFKEFLWGFGCVLIGAGIALGCLAVLGSGYVYVYPYFQRIAAARYDAAEARLENAREQRSKADVVGGITPEETLDRIVAVLMNNRPDLAGEYYPWNLRTEAIKNLEAELRERGNLEQSAAYFSRIRDHGVKHCRMSGEIGRCSFRYARSPDRVTIIDVVRNPYTHVWKITFPL